MIYRSRTGIYGTVNPEAVTQRIDSGILLIGTDFYYFIAIIVIRSTCCSCT